MVIRGLAAWLLATVLLTSAAYAHGGWVWWTIDAFCGLARMSCSSLDISRKIPGKSFVTMFQTLGKRLSRSICKKPSSATCSQNPPHQRRWNPYADEWASVLDGRGAGEQSCPRRRQHRLFPAKEISDGHADFRAYFPENGKFIGIVSVENDHGQKFVSQFPFAVGQQVGKNLVLYGMILAALIGGVYAVWHFGGKQRSPLPQKTRREIFRYSKGFGSAGWHLRRAIVGPVE